MLCAIRSFEDTSDAKAAGRLYFLSSVGSGHRIRGREKWEGDGISVARDLWKRSRLVSRVCRVLLDLLTIVVVARSQVHAIVTYTGDVMEFYERSLHQRLTTWGFGHEVITNRHS